MSVLGDGLKGGWFRKGYFPVNPAGFGMAILFAVSLIILHQVLQFAMASVAVKAMFGGSIANQREFVKATLVVIFPASLLVALAAWIFAGLRGGRRSDVLSLRWPKFTFFGWIVLLAGFMLTMYAAMIIIVLSLGIDLAQYTPGPDGQSPETGSAGLVKEAMFDIANEPWLFMLVFPSVALGAPIAEEFIFRGQLFSALSRTRIGIGGTTMVTAALWALMHVSEPWLSIGLIFIMGLVFGWMMYRFGSLWVTIACHGLWNTVYAIAIFATVGGAASP